MKKNIIMIVFNILFIGYSVSARGESLYPSGSNITSLYEINANELAIGDTLVITRTVTNNEAYDLTGLYFSENLPIDFELVAESILINGVAVSYQTGTPLPDHNIAGYNYIGWVVDLPGDGNPNNPISSGGNAVLQYKIVCIDIGNYVLPLHSAVFYGNMSGFFSTSDTVAVEYKISLDVDDNTDVEMLPADYLTSRAFPNPFNTSVVIAYSARGLKNRAIELEIYDILGRRISEKNWVAKSDRGTIYWSPEEHLGTGLYFYRLAAENKNSFGKLLMLK